MFTFQEVSPTKVSKCGNTEAITDISKVDMKVNTEKKKYITVSHHHNAGQNDNINISNITFQKLANFKYLGITVKKNLNVIHEKMKNRLHLDNACYHSFSTRLFTYMLLKNINMKICKSIILPVIL
jgi:hypothetical protein